MQERRNSKGIFGVFLMGIAFMGILYGWIVYAGEIENDIGAVTSYVSAASGKLITVDPDKIQLLQQVGNTVEAQQNESINTDLYSNSGVAPADAMITNHFSSYCAQPSENGGIGGGGLGIGGLGCPTDVLLQFGDVKISSVLSGTAYDATRAKAAQDFLTNFLTPPNGPNVTNFQANVPIDAAALTSDPNLKKNYVQALSDEAILSVVRLPLDVARAKRTVGANGISEMQMMEEQALQRFMSTTWSQMLSQMLPQQVAQDQALMQAYQIWMDYQRYRQMERVEALLATLVLQNFRAGKAAAGIAQPPSQQQISSTVQQSGSGSGTSSSSSGSGQ